MKNRTEKRAASALLAALLLLVLTACGTTATPAPTSTPQESETVQEQPAAEETQQGSSALVVYFSATGNTQSVAESIAAALGAERFVLTPAEPYTSEDLQWSDENSRVSREHSDPSLRNVELTSATVENWDSYDTVFIGYPIWWGIAAWPVDTFVAANDFTGKTVIPFCTSSSSGMGESGELLAQLAGTGDWQEGRRFTGAASAEDVGAWLSEIGLT